jgi:Arc/MetJ family transcription regulator
MTQLDPERLEEIREDAALFPEGCTPPTAYELARAFGHRDELLTHNAAQEAELEDTRAAYQLAQRQLDAHRAGRGTYQGESR